MVGRQDEMLPAVCSDEFGLGLRVRTPQHEDRGRLAFCHRCDDGVGDDLPAKLGM